MNSKRFNGNSVATADKLINALKEAQEEEAVYVTFRAFGLDFEVCNAHPDIGVRYGNMTAFVDKLTIDVGTLWAWKNGDISFSIDLF